MKYRFLEAEKHIANADLKLAGIIDERGHCTLKPQKDYFFVLCDSIISQQLSVKASATIVKRFEALFPHNKPTPELVLQLPHEHIRGVGCSAGKTLYIKDLAAKFTDTTIKPAKLKAMSDDDIILLLTQVKGIGRWTAEMFLMFSLNRPDVLPVDDLGIRKAIMSIYGLDALPKAKEIQEIGEVWKPYRTIASWYLWRSLNNH